MAQKLTKLAARLRAALGAPDPALVSAVEVLERRLVLLLPAQLDDRRHVCRLCCRAILGGWQPGSGLPGLRAALAAGVEFGDVAPDVHAELVPLLADLHAELELLPTPFD